MYTIKEINFEPLFVWINNQIGQNIPFEIRLNGKRPEIVCPNLFEFSGIFASVIKEASINFFNYQHTENGIWGTISLSYESWSGGSSGMLMGNVWCDNDGNWTFESYRDRFQS